MRVITGMTNQYTYNIHRIYNNNNNNNNKYNQTTMVSHSNITFNIYINALIQCNDTFNHEVFEQVAAVVVVVLMVLVVVVVVSSVVVIMCFGCSGSSIHIYIYIYMNIFLHTPHSHITLPSSLHYCVPFFIRMRLNRFYIYFYLFI